MDKNIINILDKIEFDKEKYSYFEDSKVQKVKVFNSINTWHIFIDKVNLLPVEILYELYNKISSLDDNVSNIEIIWNIENPDINIYLTYYNFILDKIKGLKLKDLYKDKLFISEEDCELVSRLILTHMGPWNKDRAGNVIMPVPQTREELLIHLCDYIASRNFLNVAFEDNEIVDSVNREKVLLKTDNNKAL